MQEILLLRGLPGSGKTTAAKKMHGYVHLEADMYFMREGIYVYEREKVRAAHDWCFEQTKLALSAGCSVVVANTFVKRWEMDRYLALGYPCRIQVMTGKFQNMHGVPAEEIEKMERRWEP